MPFHGSLLSCCASSTPQEYHCTAQLFEQTYGGGGLFLMVLQPHALERIQWYRAQYHQEPKLPWSQSQSWHQAQDPQLGTLSLSLQSWTLQCGQVQHDDHSTHDAGCRSGHCLCSVVWQFKHCVVVLVRCLAFLPGEQWVEKQRARVRGAASEFLYAEKRGYECWGRQMEK